MKTAKLVFLSFLIILSSIFSTGCNDDKGSGADYAFNCTLLDNPNNLDPLMASNPSALTVVQNMYSGLLKINQDGSISNDIADSSSVSEDGLTYSFILKNNRFWYAMDFEDDEKYLVTANDFVFAFRRMFNPDTQSEYRNDFSCIKNASAIINGTLPYTELGVYAENDNKLIFQLDYPNADFLSMLATPAAMPCNEDFFNTTKGRYGLDKQSVISNGSFYISEWFYDPYGPENVIIMKRNNLNSENDMVYPSSLNFSIKNTADDQVAAFKNKTADYLVSSSYPEKFSGDDYTIASSVSSTLGLVFNLNDTIFSNKNIRNAFAFSLNRENLIGSKSAVSDVIPAYGIVPPDASFLNKSYRELVAEKNISSFDAEKAKTALQNGMNELDIQSMDSIKIIVNQDSVSTDDLHYLTQQWQDVLGFYVGFEPLSQDEYYSRLQSGDYKIALYDASASYNSVFAFLEQFQTGNNPFGYSNDVVDNLVASAKTKINLNECVDIFRSTEKQIVDDCAFVPVFYKKIYIVYRKTNADILYMPFSGQIDFKYAKYFED